jgi:hypothetical protein
MEDATSEILHTLEWMIQDMEFRRDQTGLDGDAMSPEMAVAHRLLGELRQGRIACYRGE